MRWARHSRALALIVVSFALACEERMAAPPPPPAPDGYVPPVVGGGMTRPRDGGEIDGALPDGGAPTCFEVDATDVNVSLVEPGAVEPFVVRAAYLRWDPSRCVDPVLQIGLTDGACEPGAGRQLLLEIDRSAIGTTVTAGTHAVREEPTPLRVYYVATDPLDPGEPRVFGTCGPAGGSIVLEQLGDLPGSIWRGELRMLELGPCTGATDIVTAQGTLELVLAEPVEQACP